MFFTVVRSCISIDVRQKIQGFLLQRFEDDYSDRELSGQLDEILTVYSLFQDR